MNKLLIGTVIAALLLGGCSESTQQQVENTAQSVAADAKQNMEQAAERTEAAAKGADLTTAVKSALIASKQVGTEDLNVDSKDGVVFLRGRVNDQAQKDLAEEIARNTAPKGTTIENQLTVGPDDENETGPTGSPTPAQTAG